jgi:hypothetical protein
MRGRGENKMPILSKSSDESYIGFVRIPVSSVLQSRTLIRFIVIYAVGRIEVDEVVRSFNHADRLMKVLYKYVKLGRTNYVVSLRLRNRDTRRT